MKNHYALYKRNIIYLLLSALLCLQNKIAFAQVATSFSYTKQSFANNYLLSESNSTNTTNSGWSTVTFATSGTSAGWSSSNFTLPFNFTIGGVTDNTFKIYQYGIIAFDKTFNKVDLPDNVGLSSSKVPDRSVAVFWDKAQTGYTYKAYTKITNDNTGTAKYYTIKFIISKNNVRHKVFSVTFENSTNAIYVHDQYNLSSQSFALTSTLGIKLNSSSYTEFSISSPLLSVSLNAGDDIAYMLKPVNVFESTSTTISGTTTANVIFPPYSLISNPCLDIMSLTEAYIEGILSYGAYSVPGSGTIQMVASNSIDLNSSTKTIASQTFDFSTATLNTTKNISLNTSNYSQIKRIDFYYSSGTTSNGTINFNLNTDWIFDPGSYDESETPDITLNPVKNNNSNTAGIVNANPLTFSWIPNCEFESYQFQLLRLYNTDETKKDDQTRLSCTIDWTQALTIESESNINSLTLTIAEGTGYYVWRVRPIGSLYAGGIANPQNWGQWSSAPEQGDHKAYIDPNNTPAEVFYYDQFDGDKNWNYQRTFSEQLKIKEANQYATHLLQPTQSQVHLYGNSSEENTDDRILISQKVYDGVGREAINTMPAPINESKLEYKQLFFNNVSGNLYSISDFDDNVTYLNPTCADTNSSPFSYYSNNNSNLSVPSANGYHFSRVLYTNDGTNRPIEQTALGKDHKIGSNHTTKITYSSVSSQELERMFGEEAAADTACLKITTVNPDGKTTINYMLGDKTLATCQVLSGTPDNLVEAEVSGFAAIDEHSFKSYKILNLTSQQNLTVNYNLTPKDFEMPYECLDYCSSCDYTIRLYIKNLDNEDAELILDKEIPFSPTSCGNHESLTFLSPEDDPIIIGPGTFEIGRVITFNNEVSIVEENPISALDYHQQNINEIIEAQQQDMQALMDYLNNQQLDEFYTGLLDKINNGTYRLVDANESNSTSDELELVSNYQTQEGEITVKSQCCNVDIPVQYCSQIRCDGEGKLITKDENGNEIHQTPEEYLKTQTDNLFDYTYMYFWNENIEYFYLDGDRNVLDGGEVESVDDADLVLINSGDYLYNDLSHSISLKVRDAINTDIIIWEGTIEPTYNHESEDGRFYSTLSEFATTIWNYINTESDGMLIVDITMTDSEHDDDSDEDDYNINILPNYIGGMPFSLTLKCTATNLAARVEEDFENNVDEKIINQFSLNGGFDQMVNHMLEYDGYDCEKLWENWIKIVSSYKVQCFSDPSKPTIFNRNSINIFKMFLENVGIKYEAASKYPWDTEVEIVPAVYGPMGGIRTPAVIEFNPGFLEHAYKVGFYDKSTFDANSECAQLFNLTTWPPNWPADDPNDDGFAESLDDAGNVILDEQGNAILEPSLTELSWKQWFECTEGEDGATSELIELAGLPCSSLDAVCLKEMAEKNMDNCNDVCDARIQSFLNEAILLYGNDFENIAKVFCAAAAMYQHCIDGCVLTAQQGVDENGVVYTYYGSEEEALAMQKSMVYTFDIAATDVNENCNANFDKLTYDDGGTALNSIQFLILNRFNYELEKIKNEHENEEYNISGDIQTMIDNVGNYFEVSLGYDIWDKCPWTNLGGPLTLFMLGENSYFYFSNVDADSYSLDFIDKDGISKTAATISKTCIDLENEGCSPVCFQWKDPIIDQAETVDVITCAKATSTTILASINESLSRCKKTFKRKTREQYSTCEQYSNLYETFTYSYNAPDYLYTLYYYDRAGNLIKTIPPAGVNLVDGRVETVHSMATTYKYNLQKQLEETSSPDGGTTKFWYDSKGRLRFSMNAQQELDVEYSYVKYDYLGRSIEAGVSTLENFESNTDDMNFPSSSCSERVYTIYSEGSGLGNYLGDVNQPQRFLQNRISYAYTDDGVYTYYSYDPHGNVEFIVQQLPGIADAQYLKYKYDLYSNKVTEVLFNEGLWNAFYTRYSYDADNRIIKTETSRDYTNWYAEAEYEYYDHGPLKRTELGANVQGLDYTYTINGWLKGINYPSLNSADDPGGDDGSAEKALQDAFGMTLGYFSGDFNRSVGATISRFNNHANNIYKPDANLTSLYNGSITASVYNSTNIADVTLKYESNIKMNLYAFDDIYRLVNDQFKYYSAGWKSDTKKFYNNSYAYDANGNLTGLLRYADNLPGSYKSAVMDSLVYFYTSGTNQLSYSNDSVKTTKYTIDLDDQNSGNYVYNANGQLTKDESADIDNITWTATGKVDQITKADGSTINFIYDVAGRRIKKIADPISGSTKTTYYVLDATGNTLAVYEQEDAGELIFAEAPIYGANRVGLLKPGIKEGDVYDATSESRVYEITDHLGNVRVLYKHTPIDAIATSFNNSIEAEYNYYPYGMELPGMTYQSNDYRYGYNGMEKDNEVKGNGNSYTTEFRQYDPRVGRWLSIDPLAAKFPWQSPYCAFDNDPVNKVDVDGQNPVILAGTASAGVDVLLQYVEIGLRDDMTLASDFDNTSVVVSATTGCISELSWAQKIQKAGTLAKLTYRLVVEGTSSAAKQGLKQGEVDSKKVAIDMVTGVAGGRLGDDFKAAPKAEAAVEAAMKGVKRKGTSETRRNLRSTIVKLEEKQAQDQVVTKTIKGTVKKGGSAASKSPAPDTPTYDGTADGDCSDTPQAGQEVH